MAIERFGSGGRWEPILGYSRVVRAGDRVEVSGCTGVGPDGAVVSADPGEQARQAVANVVAALALAGATPAQVIRTRVYLTDVGDWEAVGRAHGAVFGDVRPAMTMVGVPALIDPAMVVEIEAVAYVGD